MGYYDLGTIKLTPKNREEARAPYVWSKPSGRLYDYHYEISGLYYQPMIRYIHEKDQGAPRTVIDIPDRALSNYDRRAYRLQPEEESLEDFLVEAYKKRMKASNHKRVHVMNELSRMSKKNTSLNMVRTSGSTRDRYLTDLKMLATSQAIRYKTVAEEPEGCVATHGDDSWDNHRNDERYGPNFVKAGRYNGRRYHSSAYQDLSQILEKEMAGEREKLEELKLKNELDLLAQNTEKILLKNRSYKTTTRTIDSDGNVTVHTTQDNGAGSRGFLSTFNDVKRQVDSAVPDLATVGKVKPQAVDVCFRGRMMAANLGRKERAALLSDKFQPRQLPDIDVGYATI